MRLLKRPFKVALSCVGILSSFFFITNTFAGGFQLWEQDASGTGDYHAGAAAEGNSAASEFYNPASITRLKKAQVSGGGTLIGIQVNYTGTANIPPFGVTSINNAPGGTVNFVPNIHFVTPLSQRWFFSFGVTTPFGLETNYPDDPNPLNPSGGVWDLATKTKLLTININPNLAFAVNKHLSLSAGFDVLYGEANYDADIFEPMISKLSGWNCGYNLGALILWGAKTRLGLSYRSGITIDAVGKSRVSGGASSDNTSAKFPLPSTTIVSLHQIITPKFTVMVSAFYTDWSVFKQLVLKDIATIGGVTTIRINENYRNTWNFALGGKYYLNHYVSFEAGFGHDETPTRLGYRDIRLPGSDRWAASFGVNITPKPGLHLSMGWTHFFIPTTSIDNTQSGDPSNSVQPQTTTGSAKGTVNVLGVQLSCDV